MANTARTCSFALAGLIVVRKLSGLRASAAYRKNGDFYARSVLAR
jgi:hypothetical protein